MGSSESAKAGASAAAVTNPNAEGNPARAPAPAAAALDEWAAFRIDCLKSALYHDDRERYYERWHKFTMLVAVLSSTSAFAFVNEYRWFVAAIAVAGVVDLVFDVSGKARLHAGLRRRFYDIYALAEDASRSLPRLREQAARLYAEEPPCRHAVNALAYNGAMQAYDRPIDAQFPITRWQRFVRHWWPFTSEDFKTRDENARASAKSAGRHAG
jgi:hypothetical protein